MKTNRHLSVLLTIVMVIGLMLSITLTASAADGTTWDGTSVATAFAGGTGAETDPYIIETAGQLIFLRNQVNSGNDYDGMYFRLDADLDMAGKTFGAAIGTDLNNSTGRYFNGHFDGNNHTISNLTIGNNSMGYSALFGNVGFNGQEIVIKDLTLVNVNVNRTSTNYGAAALVGNAGYLRLENCTVESGTVNSKAYTAAGLVATANAISAKGLTVINCVNKADITHTGSTGNGTGGIVGTGCSSGTTITGCINYGNVSANSYAGGIIGEVASATVTKCANYGNISAKGTTGTYAATAKAAGILTSGGGYPTLIEDCFNAGTITSDGTIKYGGATVNAGGAAGIAAFNKTNSEEKKIINCHNVGTLSGDYGYPIAIRSTLISGSYYLNDATQRNSQAIKKTADEFADGTVLALLNGNRTGNDAPWEQGSDYPVLKSTSITPVPPTEFKVFAFDADTKTATVEIPTAGTYSVIFADYDGTRLANIEIIPVTVTEAKAQTVTITKNFTLGTDDKIMLWKDMTTIVPLCEAYIVK